MVEPGSGPWGPGESWEYIEDPLRHVVETQGLVDEEIRGTDETPKDALKTEAELASLRSGEVKAALPKGGNQWSSYPQDQPASPGTSPVDPNASKQAGKKTAAKAAAKTGGKSSSKPSSRPSPA